MGKIARIVQGNTFGTAITIQAVDAQGHEIQDFSLEGSTDLRVWYVFAGKDVDIEAWNIEDGKVVILWDGRDTSLRLGTYDIFIQGKFSQTAWRNAMKAQFTLVKYNYEAYIPDDVIVLDGIYQISAQMSLITRVSGGGGGTPSETIPLMDGEASVGEENAYARGDHRHPTDTSRQAVINDLDAIRSGAQAGATAYQKPATGIPLADLASGVQTSLGKADTAVQPSGLTAIETALQTIEDVIPSSSSSSNQLADKAFVNSSISTNTATFKGTYSSFAELQQVTATNNDYAFVTETDQYGNDYYDRYKYVTGTGWVYEYKIESTPFTQAQWNAIQSGITSSLVTKLSDLPTATELGNDLAGKQSTIDSSHKLSADLVDDTSTTNKFVTASDITTWNGKANKVLVENHGTSDTTFAVTPNTLHIWGTVASLTLTLATPTDNTIVNEYMIEFTSGSTATTLSLPSSVEWAESCGSLSVEASKTYQISIVNNIGLWCAV